MGLMYQYKRSKGVYRSLLMFLCFTNVWCVMSFWCNDLMFTEQVIALYFLMLRNLSITSCTKCLFIYKAFSGYQTLLPKTFLRIVFLVFDHYQSFVCMNIFLHRKSKNINSRCYFKPITCVRITNDLFSTFFNLVLTIDNMNIIPSLWHI